MAKDIYSSLSAIGKSSKGNNPLSKDNMDMAVSNHTRKAKAGRYKGL